MISMPLCTRILALMCQFAAMLFSKYLNKTLQSQRTAPSSTALIGTWHNILLFSRLMGMMNFDWIVSWLPTFLIQSRRTFWTISPFECYLTIFTERIFPFDYSLSTLLLSTLALISTFLYDFLCSICQCCLIIRTSYIWKIIFSDSNIPLGLFIASGSIYQILLFHPPLLCLIYPGYFLILICSWRYSSPFHAWGAFGFLSFLPLQFSTCSSHIRTW